MLRKISTSMYAGDGEEGTRYSDTLKPRQFLVSPRNKLKSSCGSNSPDTLEASEADITTAGAGAANGFCRGRIGNAGKHASDEQIVSLN